ncbi:hypothetical protein PG984_011754 [Apiospora sp. TS-2023a]
MPPSHELPPTPPPTRPTTPDSMIINAGSNERQDSHPSSTEQPQQHQPQPQQLLPPPAVPPPPSGHFIPGLIFGPPPPHPATAATELPPTPPRTPPNDGTTPHQVTIRPLDYYFGPHLNNDTKRRRAVHEYMLCRMTQDLTTSYVQHTLLALISLMPLPPPPPISLPLEAASPETIVTALLIREMVSLLEREASLRAAAVRIVRMMWSLGLSGRTVARADAFVRGRTPPPSSSWEERHRPYYRRSLAQRFRDVYGDSYLAFRLNSYYPHTFHNIHHTDWCYSLGLCEFDIGP